MNEFQKMKEKYLELQSTADINPQSLFKKMILDFFIVEMQYQNCKYNYSHNMGTNDIEIIAENREKLYLRFIESNNITSSHIQDYIKFLHHKGLSSEIYGILTNGREYLLLNSRFYNQKDEQNSIIFWFDLLSSKAPNRQKYFSYLSKQAIIDNKAVNNFKMIAQFKIYYNADSKSYAQYVSTLESFFYYFAPPTCSVNRNFTFVSTQDIYGFLDEKRKAINENSGRKLNKKTSLNNTYSHISSFYKCLYEHNEIKQIHIETSRKEALRLYPNTQPYRHTMQITNNDISLMIDILQKSRYFKRNLAIFALCAYLGLERKTIYNLNWENIVEYDKEYPHIIIENRKIPICNLLTNYFSDLRNQNNIDIHTQPHLPVFTSGRFGNRLSESAINDVFDSFKKLSKEPNDKWSKMCPQILRFTLIEELFQCGFSIEEIIYITGIDINNIGKYISNADIIFKYNNPCQSTPSALHEKLKICHPYTKIFN